VKGAAVMSASKRFLKTREVYWTCPSMHGFSRLLNANIELHQQILPGNPKGLGWPGIAFVLYRDVLICISGLVLFWNRLFAPR
jgi:hypothetical protein